MCQSGIDYGKICILDLGLWKEENLRLEAREVWKSTLSLDKEKWLSRKAEILDQQVGHEGRQSDRWVWRLSKGIKVTRADLLLLQGKRKEFWDGKKKSKTVLIGIRKV